MAKFKIGDEVLFEGKGKEIVMDIDRWGNIKGMYCNTGLASDYYVDSRRYTLIKESTIKDRIEALTGESTLKETDDLAMEIWNEWKEKRPSNDTINRKLVIPMFDNGEERICIQNYKKETLFDSSYSGQCSKLKALKSNLLWLAAKAGLLKEDLVGKEMTVEIDGKKYTAKIIK